MRDAHDPDAKCDASMRQHARGLVERELYYITRSVVKEIP
jgi:hypothetical protein